MIDADTRRVMPHNENAEKAVLGAMLCDNKTVSESSEILTKDDFYSKGNRCIFESIIRLTDRGGAADLLTVSNDLRNAGLLDKSGGAPYIAELTDSVISASNARHYAEIVKDKANERRIIETANMMTEAVYSGQAEEAISIAQKLSIERHKSTIRAARDVAKTTLHQIEDSYKRGGDIVTGTATGMTDLDEITGGLPDGGLIIIAGRPGMGKSAVAGHIAKYAALHETPTVIFSLEMPAESIMLRFFANMTNINSRQLRRGYVHNSQWGTVIEAVQTIGQAPLFIDDQVDITPTAIRAKARQLKTEHGLGLLIVDYIQLVRVPGKHDTREQAVAEISRTLKAIARELNIPVIGLSQLNRQVDSRADKRPMLSDLRESGAIEQDADIIAFIYRDELYDKRQDNPNRGIVEIEIAKHRNGPTGTIKLRFNAATQSFKDMETPGWRERRE